MTTIRYYSKDSCFRISLVLFYHLCQLCMFHDFTIMFFVALNSEQLPMQNKVFNPLTIKFSNACAKLNTHFTDKPYHIHL